MAYRVWATVAAGLMIGTAAIAAPAPQARFDYVSYVGSDPAARAPVPAGMFANPVLPGFQPDPSIVRDGDDYYLVNSTFSWFPGLPIYHSRDLVNWRQVGNAIDRPGQVPIGALGVTRGLFAPTISKHDGRFYIFNTCVDCRGNFVITADDPAGPWSDPHWLDFGGIDPSMIVDTDGRAYVVYNDAPPGKPEYDGHRALWLQEIDLKKLEMKPKRALLVDKGVHPADKPVWAEGPHIFRKDGYYYLMPAEGGTADQHSQTIYRARKVDGPYEPGPVNPILTQRDLPDGRPWPVQATGHADIVELPDGSWWAVFLATRPYEGQRTALGRETFLLPVIWKDGWPLILPAAQAVPRLAKRPALPAQPAVDYTRWREEFDATRLDMDWLMLRTPEGRPWWSTTSAPGTLSLTARPVAAGSLGQPSFIGRRLRHPVATVETRVRFDPQAAGDRAGLLALTDENHFLFAGLERGAEGNRIVIRRRSAAQEPEAGAIVASVPAGGATAIDTRLSIDRGTATVAWRPAGTRAWRAVGSRIDATNLATIEAGLFTGLVIGPHAARN